MTYYIIILLLIITHAALDAILIRHNNKIDHIKESLLFGVLWGVLTIFFKIEIKEAMLYVVISRIGLFDFSLNLFRNLNIFYISPNVDGNYTGKYESRWDEVVNKHANLVRVAGFVLTLIFLIKKF